MYGKVIIVEDELIAAEYLKEILQTKNFEVIAIINNGQDALKQIPLLNPDIVLMDIMLKDHISGTDVALSLKYNAPDIPIIFLTAYAENDMISYAIEANSYGYLMKPYDEQNIITSLTLILARIEVTQREKKVQNNLVHIQSGLYFDREQKRLFREDKEVPLGHKSLALLETLCKRPNITVISEELSLAVWGEVKERSMLRTQISRLKKEIGKDVIENIKGFGYKIVCTD